MKANYRELSVSETLEVSGGTLGGLFVIVGVGINLSGLGTAVTSVANTASAVTAPAAAAVSEIVVAVPANTNAYLNEFGELIPF